MSFLRTSGEGVEVHIARIQTIQWELHSHLFVQNGNWCTRFMQALCKHYAGEHQADLWGSSFRRARNRSERTQKKKHFVMSWEFPRALNRVFSAGRVEIFGSSGPVFRSSAQSSSKHPVPPSQSYSPTLPHSSPY
jgi:hypothetical protein